MSAMMKSPSRHCVGTCVGWGCQECVCVRVHARIEVCMWVGEWVGGLEYKWAYGGGRVSRLSAMIKSPSCYAQWPRSRKSIRGWKRTPREGACAARENVGLWGASVWWLGRWDVVRGGGGHWRGGLGGWVGPWVGWVGCGGGTTKLPCCLCRPLSGVRRSGPRLLQQLTRLSEHHERRWAPGPCGSRCQKYPASLGAVDERCSKVGAQVQKLPSPHPFGPPYLMLVNGAILLQGCPDLL